MNSIQSNNYALVTAHYKALLSEHYTWTFGGAENKYQMNGQLFRRYLKNDEAKIVLDLGCGSGFQTVPLLRMQHHVTAIDLSQALLDELQEEARKNDSQRLLAIQGDLLSFPVLTEGKTFDLIVCMGDTLTHLATLAEVNQLLSQCFQALNPNGMLMLQFRDLTKPLHGTDRFIPVRSDERTVFTCFLEWEMHEEKEESGIEGDGSGCHIRVHDLVNVKKGIGAWELCKSWYLKLGLSGQYVASALEKSGFKLVDAFDESGMVTLVAHKL